MRPVLRQRFLYQSYSSRPLSELLLANLSYQCKVRDYATNVPYESVQRQRKETRPPKREYGLKQSKLDHRSSQSRPDWRTKSKTLDGGIPQQDVDGLEPRPRQDEEYQSARPPKRRSALPKKKTHGQDWLEEYRIPKAASYTKTSISSAARVRPPVIMEKVIMEKNSKDLRFKYRNSDGSEASLPPPKLESSASIILISPKNEVLLVHRVKNASTYPSAHVFPGGSHENGQDGRVQKQDMKRYRDCKEYRRTAIRELFEETGILLARDQVTGHYLSLSNEEREKGRSALRAGAVKFQPWIHLMGGMNAWPDIENLHQFTSWITPVSGHQRRFYTQFYLYFLSSPGSKKDNIGIADSSELQAQLPSSASSFSVLSYDSAGRPKPDNEEVLSAEFAKPSTWLSKASQDDIMLFPPQFMLLNILKQHLENPSSRADESSLTSQEIVNHRRQNFISFINGTDISSSPPPSFPPSIDTILPWKRKYISPYSLKSVLRPSLNPRSPDPIPKQVLALDWAGPELCRRALRYGDTSYVILANFTPSGPRSLELLPRSQFMTPTEEKILVLQKGAANTNSKRKKKSPDDMRARILRKAVLRELHEMEVQAANMKKKLSRKGNKGDGNGDNNDEAWTEYRELREHLAIQKRELGLSDESLENVGKEKEEEEEEEAKGFEDDVDVDVDFDAENGDGGIGSLRKSKL